MRPVVGDLVKHFKSERPGVVRYVGDEKMVIFFPDEQKEQFRWISAFGVQPRAA